MSLSNLQNESFRKRLEVSEVYTGLLIKLLTKAGHFKKVVRKATKEEEDRGIDYWVVFDEEEVPIQFKIRAKRKDCPVCRFQPLYGIDHPKNVVGRDYRGLGNSHYYYVAISDNIFNLIYRIPCQKLKDLVLEANEAWEKAETYSLGYFTSENVKKWKTVTRKLIFSYNGIEFWWNKTTSEVNPKINMYIPHNHKDWEYRINEKDSQIIEKAFSKIIGG